MKKCIVISILSLLIFVVACETNNVQNPELTWGESSNRLRCSISIEKSTFSSSMDTPLIVSIVVENVSHSRIELKTIPAFTLNDMEYWCPVDIFEEKHLPANTRSIISLKKGASITSKVDISKLGWDLGISSIWPQHYFYDLIGQGNYKLHLGIQITEHSEPEWIRSNEIIITISD